MSNSSLKNKILIGAGGHGLVIAETIVASGENIVCFLDQDKTKTSQGGLPVYVLGENHQFPDGIEYIISIGNNRIRKNISEAHTHKFGMAIHPTATISPSATIEIGTVVMAGVCVNASATIGAHVILNTGCIVEHECVLENFVHISPKAALAGNVCVGEGSHIGIGAVVLPGIKIGKWCTIGAGAVVLEDVPDGITVVGVPARPLLK